MKYQEFVDSILRELNSFYGDDATVSINTVVCNNNEIRDALHIRFTADNGVICPSIYLDSLYEDYTGGQQNLDYYVEAVIQMRKDYEPDNIMKESVKKLLDWNCMKDVVYPVLVSQEENERFLAHHVHTPFLDLAVIYEVRVSDDKNGVASSKVTHSMLNSYEISKEALHQQALENMKKDGYEMADLLYQMFGQFMDEDSEEQEDVSLEAGKMYVLSNRSKRHGAACLLYEDFLKEKLGDTTAFIIPSSIHETLFVPVVDGMTAEAFNQMICQVNEAEVKASERLSNHCYLWDGKEQKVKMAA